MRNSQGSRDGPRPPRRPAATESDSPYGDMEDSALWAAVGRGDGLAVEELTRRFENVAKVGALALMGRGLDKQILLDEARQAIRAAILSCDGAQRASFAGYAQVRIRNRLIDAIRENGPRTPHECDQDAHFAASKEELAHKLKAMPSDDEVYDELGWSRTQRLNHQAARERANAAHRRIDYDKDQREAPDSNAVERTEDKNRRLHQAIRGLNDPHRRLIVGRYFDPAHPTRKALAAELGVNVGRVRTMENEALDQIEQILTQSDIELDAP